MNYVIARPTQRSIERIMAMFRSCPFNVDFDQMHLRLYKGETVPTKHSEPTQLIGMLGTAQIWFNKTEGFAEFSSPTYSPSILDRYKALGGTDDTECRFMFMQHAPALSRANRAFIASFANSVVIESKTLPFSFDPDKLVSA